MMHLSKWGAPEFTLHLLAGCGATFFHDSVMTPAEVNEHLVRQILVLCAYLLRTADTGQSLPTMQYNAMPGDQAADADVLLATQECNLCLQGELD